MTRFQARQLMLQDGAPDALFMSTADRAATWAGRPLTVPTPFVPRRDDSAEAQAMREQLRQEEKTALLNRLARSKARKETTRIDHSRMRWDPRRCKFVEDTAVVTENRGFSGWASPVPPTPPKDRNKAETRHVADAILANDWSRVRPDTARTLAELNGVWNDKYTKLSGGLLVMTVTNRLKGLVKQGGEIRWTR